MSKPRLKYADVFKGLDFEHMPMGTPLMLEGERVTFDGENNGNVWIKVNRKNVFLRKGDPVIGLLRRA